MDKMRHAGTDDGPEMMMGGVGMSIRCGSDTTPAQVIQLYALNKAIKYASITIVQMHIFCTVNHYNEERQMEWALKQASTEMQTASPLVHWPQRLLQLSFENDWRRDAQNLPINDKQRWIPAASARQMLATLHWSCAKSPVLTAKPPKCKLFAETDKSICNGITGWHSFQRCFHAMNGRLRLGLARFHGQEGQSAWRRRSTQRDAVSGHLNVLPCSRTRVDLKIWSSHRNT